MSTILIILIIMLVCSIIAGMVFWYAMQHRLPLRKLPFLPPPHRHLTAEERNAVEHYIQSLASKQHQLLPVGVSSLPESLTLTSQSNKVFSVTRAITRYGLSSDEPQKWRYYLDSVEVHLPPLWEQHIADENYVEIIKTQTIPLIISLNGHSLLNYLWEQAALSPLSGTTLSNASIRKEESENIELISIRKETAEEYMLSRSDGSCAACTISLGLFLFFCSLISAISVMPWLILLSGIIAIIGCGLLYQHHFPPLKKRQDIHCLRGAPKRWGLFGESNQGQLSNISLGIIDLIYPAHWQSYVTHDLGNTTDVDIYLNHHVVRQGNYLSLHDEVRHFPFHPWKKNAILAASSLLILILLLFWVPLSIPIKLSTTLLTGTESIQVTSSDDLQHTSLHVGDRLKVTGTGMCSVLSSFGGNRTSPFTPFDCSAVYWNNAAPPPLPRSDIIDKAASLLAVVNQQLHPQVTSDPKLNPQLASAIQKSGMILLDDFTDLVLKTQALCSQPSDCLRLKNALANLGNVKNWELLVQHAVSGDMKGMNVLLRPVSAEALENLVNTATSSFFYRETHQAAAALNTPPAGGFLIINDEGLPLVSHAPPTIPLFDYNALDQWHELQQLATMLLKTPFKASGVITGISTDTQGTRHITLHSQPNTATLCRYLSTTFLLGLVTLSGITNLVLALKRLHCNRERITEIQRYYDSCFNAKLRPHAGNTPRF